MRFDCNCKGWYMCMSELVCTAYRAIFFIYYLSSNNVLGVCVVRIHSESEDN